MHVQINCYVQQMCKGIIMGTPLSVPITICNIIRTMHIKSARKQHVCMYIREDRYISSPRKYWDIMLWVHKNPTSHPLQWHMNAHRTSYYYQYTFTYISVYLRSLIPLSSRGTPLTSYMLITPSHQSFSS